MKHRRQRRSSGNTSRAGNGDAVAMSFSAQIFAPPLTLFVFAVTLIFFADAADMLPPLCAGRARTVRQRARHARAA